MEENIKKNKSKKVSIFIFVIILIVILAVAAVIVYKINSRKPEKIFGKAIEKTFDEMNSSSNSKKGMIKLKLTGGIETDNSEMRMLNEILREIQLTSVTKFDLDKKILDENISVKYDDEQVINVDGLIQDEKMYFFLEDIFEKYIEVDEEYLQGTELSTIFEAESAFNNDDLIKELEEILNDEVNKKEFTGENAEIDGKKVRKSTLKLTIKEVQEITLKLLKKVNEYDSTEELQDIIADLEYEIEHGEDIENYIEISIYTKGFNNEFVKMDVALFNIEYDEVVVIELKNISENEIIIKCLLNEESTDISDSIEIMEVKIKTRSENEGTITLKLNVKEDLTILNLEYEISDNINLKERDTSNSVKINDLTETDFNEMLNNIEKNEILYAIISQMILSSETLENTESVADDYQDVYENEQYVSTL